MKKAFILGCLLAGVVVAFLIRFLPPNDDFHLDNPFWNGLKTFQEKTQGSSLSYISDIDFVAFPSETCLFIIGPSGSYSAREIASIERYLRAGGLLILADDFGSGNLILEGLGLKTRFSHQLVIDPLFRGKSSVLVKSVDFSGPLADIKSLMFNFPTFLQVERGEGRVFATSSSFSISRDSLVQDEASAGQEGPFPMVAEITYGAGKIYLIADSSLFINSMLGEGENEKLLQTITQDKKIFIDTSHHPKGLLAKMQSTMIALYQITSRFEIRYSLFLVLVIAVLWLKVKKRKVVEDEDIEAILKRHPAWDKNTLVKLKKEHFNE